MRGVGRGAPGLAGSIGFYGHPHRAADVIPSLHAPLLIIGGGADKGIPPGDLREFAEAVRNAGGGAELVVYDDAPHSFFDRATPEYQAACDDSWRRIREFIGL
jgi:carboxymethylenebutenolidase